MIGVCFGTPEEEENYGALLLAVPGDKIYDTAVESIDDVMSSLAVGGLTAFSVDSETHLILHASDPSFVGKKLGDGILKEEISKIKAPYDEKKVLSYDAKSMQNLSYKSGDKTTEHIFPFLVQYNESFYDMLARTTNRWGEFMYYEGGKLIVGCPNSTSTPYPLPMTLGEVQAEANTLKVPLFDTISYYNVDELENGSEKFDCAASYDDNMLNDPRKVR